jgi:hypothetical protein
MAEACNRVDDDCDGVTDDYAVDCSTICGPGTDRCVAGEWLGCTAPQPIACLDWATCEVADYCGDSCPPAAQETCNGIDDDCDGATDGMTQACATDCGVGTETCELGAWVDCTAPAALRCFEYATCTPFQTCNPEECPEPPAEECNAVDDDCDGTTDRFTRPCATDCGEGVETCIAGLWTICDGPTRQLCTDYSDCVPRTICVTACPAPPAEGCNGRDDDCDGVTDSMIRPCSSDCGQGTERCTGGSWGGCTAPPSYTCTDWATCQAVQQCAPDCALAPEETCNGVDDDCDGTTDGLTRRCVTVCGEGLETCPNGEWVGCTARRPIRCPVYSNCTEAEMCLDACPAAPAETCNNRDDDCDGTTDGQTVHCSTACGTGTNQCVAGRWQGCTAMQPVTCIDLATCRPRDECIESCPPLPGESCNGLDDNCDGVTDDYDEPCALACGEGVRHCTDGQWSACEVPGYLDCTDWDTCETVARCGTECPPAPPETCNGRDDDCNGQTDEGPGESLCPPAPAAACDGDVLHASGPPSCASGGCVYPDTGRLCAYGCASGACLPCEGGCLGVPCGEDRCGLPCGDCPDGAPLAAGSHDLLNILARWYVNAATDYRDVISSAEAPGGTFDGQLFYLMAQPGNAGAAIYRLVGAGPDWMLSQTSTVAGYTLDGIVGYSVAAIPSWLCTITDWYSAARADHATAACGEDLTAAGYVQHAYVGIGYRRHGTACEVPQTIWGWEVRVVANRVAGGAISELWWGGRQFLNRRDFGRYLQTRLRNGGDADQHLEAGDRYGCSGATAGGWAHGSPLLDLHEAPRYLATVTRPLLWEPAGLGGGPDHPVLWRGTFEKEVEFDRISPHVVEWTVTVDAPSGTRAADVDILRATLTADFTNAYVYDALRDELVDVAAAIPAGGCLEPGADARLRPVAGAAVLATGDGAYALGLYRRDDRHALRFCRQDGSGGETGDAFRSAAAVFQAPGGLAPGAHAWQVYVLVGTLEDVRTEARALYER